MPPTKNIEKLPKWAQHEIERLQANADYWQRKYESTSHDTEGPVTQEYGWGEDKTTVHLDPDADVRYHLPDGTRIDVALKGDNTGVRLVGSESLVVYPVSSKVIVVETWTR